MERPAVRLTSVMGVARALLLTVGPRETSEILITEFGWDQTFQALAMLRGDEANAAFSVTWEHLLLATLDEQLHTPMPPPPGSADR